MTTKANLNRLGPAAVALAFLLSSARPAAAEPVTLDAAIDRAIASSAGLEVVQSQTAERDAAAREAESGFYPRLNLEAGYLYRSETPKLEINIESPIGPIQKSINAGYNDNWSAKAVLTQPLFTGGAVWYGRKAAGYAIDSSRFQSGQVRNDLTAEVTNVFYGALLARETVAVLTESVANAERHLVDVRNRYDAGSAARSEVLRAEVQLNLLAPQLSQAREQQERAQQALAILIGLPAGETVEPEGSLVLGDAPIDESSLLATAYTTRPELASITATRHAAEEGVKAARAGWLPKAQLQGSYVYDKPYFLEQDGADYFTVGVGVQVPVFDGLQTLAKVDRYKAKVLQADAAQRAQRDRIRMEVQDATIRCREGGARVPATADNVDLAADALRMTEDAYREGVATNLDVMDSNQRLLEARLAHLKAVYDVEIARNDLARAVGRYAEGD